MQPCLKLVRQTMCQCMHFSSWPIAACLCAALPWSLTPLIAPHVASSMHVHGFCVQHCLGRGNMSPDEAPCVIIASCFSVSSIVWT